MADKQVKYGELLAYVKELIVDGFDVNADPMHNKQPLMAHLAKYFEGMSPEELEAEMSLIPANLDRDLREMGMMPADLQVFLDFATLDVACRVVALLAVIEQQGHSSSSVMTAVLQWLCGTDGNTDEQHRRLLTFLDLLRNGFAGETFPPEIGAATLSATRHDAMSEFLCALSSLVRMFGYMESFSMNWSKVHAWAMANGGGDYASTVVSLTFTEGTLQDIMTYSSKVDRALKLIASADTPSFDVPFAATLLKGLEGRRYPGSISGLQGIDVTRLMKELLIQEFLFLMAHVRRSVCTYNGRILPVDWRSWENVCPKAKRKRIEMDQDAILARHTGLVEKAKAALSPEGSGVKPITCDGFVTFICGHGLLNGAVMQLGVSYGWTSCATPPRDDDDDDERHIDLTADDGEYDAGHKYIHVLRKVPDTELDMYPRLPRTYTAIGVCYQVHITVVNLPKVLSQIVDFYRVYRPGTVDDHSAAHIKAAIENEIGSGYSCDGTQRVKRELYVERMCASLPR